MFRCQVYGSAVRFWASHDSTFPFAQFAAERSPKPGDASNGGEADNANEVRPDAVFMDIGMPGASSVESTRQIKKSRAETRFLLLSDSFYQPELN
jgi:DNA-binding NarL/FixJ family response regulator